MFLPASRSVLRPPSSAHPRTVAAWLSVCALMIFIMVIIGGLTRLTHSGLSMVEWKPLTGILPPLSAPAWEELFSKYRQYPEFSVKNPDMDMAGFKSIFWLEYIHRLWGRLIAVVFFVPFLFFLLKKKLSRALAPQLAVVFILGALQGLLGWFMVKSGLTINSGLVGVSHYRLAAHLGLAFLLYGWLIWMILQLLCPAPRAAARETAARRHVFTALLLALALTILSGALVAGTDAGKIYNTYPLMGETLLPKDSLILQPRWLNFFENPVTIQLTHRVLTLLTFALALGACLSALFFSRRPPPRARWALQSLLFAAILQMTLGIATLLLAAPLMLAALHQAGALLLLTTALWARHEIIMDGE